MTAEITYLETLRRELEADRLREEVEEVVRAYVSVRDPVMRRTILDLLTSVASTERGVPLPHHSI